MTEHNGHQAPAPFPSKPPPVPAPRPAPERVLVVELRDGNVVETDEPTEQEVVRWLIDRGYAVYDARQKPNGVAIADAIEEALRVETRDTDPPAATEVENERPELKYEFGPAANTGRLPSERIAELRECVFVARTMDATDTWLRAIGAYLDERLGRAP